MSSSDTGSFMDCPGCDASYDVTGFDPGKVFECQLCGAEIEVDESRLQPSESGSSPPGDRRKPGTRKRTSSRGKSTKTDSGSGRKKKTTTRRRKGKGRKKSSNKKRSSGGRTGRRSSSSDSSTMLMILAIGGFLVIGLVFFFMMGDVDDTSSSTQVASSEEGEHQERSSSAIDTGPPEVSGESGASDESSKETGTDDSSDDSSGSESTDASATNQSQSGDTGTSSEGDGTSNDPSDRQGKSKKKQSSASKPAKRKVQKEWKYDESISKEFIEAFSGAQSKSFSELKEKREKLIDKYTDKKIIPAAIHALFETDSTWVADEINKTLKEVTKWRKAPVSMKGPDPNIIDRNAKAWKDYWLSVDWDKQKQVAEQKQKIEQMVEELKPLCEQVTSSSFDERTEAKKKIREKGTEYIPGLIELLHSKYGKASQGAYKFLTEYTDRNPDLPTGDRSEHIEGWKDWWAKNRSSFSY